VSHVTHRRVVGDGGPGRRCGWCVGLFRCEGRNRGEFCKWWRWEARDVLSKFLSKFELGDGRQSWRDWKWFWRVVGTEIRVVIGELLDVILDQAVNVPFEHRAINVQAEFVGDVFVDFLRVWRATHALDTQKFKVAFFKVIETVAGDRIGDVSEFWHEAGGRHRL
jgi:hypothetical protein